LTRLPVKTGAVILVLLFALGLGVLAQEEGEDPATITQDEFNQLKEKVDSLEKNVEELASLSEGLDQTVKSNQSAIAGLEEEQALISDSVTSIQNTLSENEDQWARIPELDSELKNLQGRFGKLVGELNKLDREADDEGQKVGELTEEVGSVSDELTEVRKDLAEIKENLKNIRENTFDNERRLENLEEDYKASARRNLLVAAGGIVIGLVAITLYWA